LARERKRNLGAQGSTKAHPFSFRDMLGMHRLEDLVHYLRLALLG
jgi:hypothetical protein